MADQPVERLRIEFRTRKKESIDSIRRYPVMLVAGGVVKHLLNLRVVPAFPEGFDEVGPNTIVALTHDTLDPGHAARLASDNQHALRGDLRVARPEKRPEQS